jgi:hypothetical protein
MLAATVGCTTVYAAVRYNVFKGVPWSQFPLYTMNKALAWSSVVMFTAVAWSAFKKRSLAATNGFLSGGAALAAAHVLISLLLFGPVSFPNLFEDAGRISFNGGVSMLAGVLAAAAVLMVRKRGSAIAVLPFAVALHTSFMGAQTWLTPGKWPGYMLPITLLSFLAAVAMLVIVILWAVRAGRDGNPSLRRQP